MHKDGFLLSGFYIVVSSFVLAALVAVCILGGRFFAPFGFFTQHSIPVQLAIWEVIWLCVVGWAIWLKRKRKSFVALTRKKTNSWLFFQGRCWTFDSLSWPISPVFASLFFYFTIPHVTDTQSLRQVLCLGVSCFYAVRLNSNYFRVVRFCCCCLSFILLIEGLFCQEGIHCIGLQDWRYTDIQRQLAAKGWSWLLPSFVLVYIVQWLMVRRVCSSYHSLFEKKGVLCLPSHVLRVFRIESVLYGRRRSLFFDCVPWRRVGILRGQVSFVLLFLFGNIFDKCVASQLQDFIKFEKRGSQLCEAGLWAITRHPNYLGQCSFWFGLGLWGYLHDSGPLVLLLSQNIIGLIVFYSVREKGETFSRIF
jgi:hypothetical protein